MSYIVTTDFELNKIAAPNLPLATPEYSQQYIDQLNNILRLYFNRLDALLAQLTASGSIDPALLVLPYFSAYQDGETTLTVAIPNGTSTADINVVSTANFVSAGYIILEQEIIQYTGKTSTTFTGITRGVLGTNAGKSAHTIGTYVTEGAAVAAGSSAPIALDVVTVSNDFTFTPYDSKIYFDKAGIYNIQFSAQLLNYTTSIDDVRIWLVKNGSIVSYSAGLVEVPSKHGTTPGALIAGWNYVDQFAAGDYFELYWRSVSGDTVIATYPQGTAPTRPTSPGLILTVTYVSGLP